MNGPLIEKLTRYIPTLLDDDFPINIRSESYLDIFDDSKLIYLSPNAPTNLHRYDADTIYILGAYVDKVKLLRFHE